MADNVTDPEAIRFVNEVVRPQSEAMRASVVALEGAAESATRLLPGIPNDPTSLIMDGREAEGVSRLNGAEIHALEEVRQTLLTTLTPGIRALISKACVRHI